MSHQTVPSSAPLVTGAAPSATATATPTITIPQSNQNDQIVTAREAVVSPIQKKTGTRSTFCTRIKPCAHTEENKEEPPRPTGLLERLGVCQQTNYGDTSAKDDTPVQHSYY
ncbi:hypothetical protein BGZ73_000780 [Actinomortierella ambigua]|nr:hypothetical protein BGZ73_000780 [Actinomortierella ambigua]